MKNELVDWFQWNNAANHSFIKVFQQNPIVSKKAIEVFSHIINEHEIWLNRICSVDSPGNQSREVEELDRFEVMNSTIHSITATFLSSESYGNDLGWSFQYVNESGHRVESTLKDVYFQILTYSEFCRGQLAKLLEEEGIERPVTDYFSFRNHLN